MTAEERIERACRLLETLKDRHSRPDHKQDLQHVIDVLKGNDGRTIY